MSNTKTVMGQASNQYVAPTMIEDVFSTYLYTGNGTTQTITNGIDLAGEGGLVWTKVRAFPNGGDGRHALFDTARSSAGSGEYLSTNNTDAAETTFDTDFGGFNSDGYSLSGSVFNGALNLSGNSYASWTFRKAPRFFDVVTYTGDGVAGRQIPHNLGTTVGSIFVKRTDAASDWVVYHRRPDSSGPQSQYFVLNTTAGVAAATSRWNDTQPTDSVFTLGNSVTVNASGGQYVAYLFAHDPLGPSGDSSDGLIACGSYVGNSNANGPEINLGWEPQWVLIKGPTGTSWYMFDNMRGITSNGNDPRLQANQADAEFTTQNAIRLLPNGFKLESSDGNWNGLDEVYLYIAIRRGPMRPPESGTEVFAMDTLNGSTLPSWKSGFPVDMNFWRSKTQTYNWELNTRLTNTRLFTNLTNAEQAISSNGTMDYQNGFGSNTATSSEFQAWMFRRAPEFFDTFAYSGTSTATVYPHNLGAVPELVIIKNRTGVTNWKVWHKDFGTTYELNLNSANAVGGQGWISTLPTSTNIRIGVAGIETNTSGYNYIAYLFASKAGVSKVGSYTGTGGNQNIDCGFTTGARFVLIKRTDASGYWWIADTARGIVTGNDPILALNDSSAEVTAFNMVEPYSAGFTVAGTGNIDNSWNANGGQYIFLAIA